jgi:hypothetical protein
MTVNPSLTPETLKATDEMIDAANALILATAYASVVTPVVEKIHQDVLNENRYAWDMKIVFCGRRSESDKVNFLKENGEYCSKPSLVQLTGSKNFNDYFVQVAKKLALAGFEVNDDVCPMLEAIDLEWKAKKVLIDTMQPTTGFKYDDFFKTTKWKEHIERYVDLLLRWLAPHLRNTLVK